ncbi:L-threonylcarbamoyladenylate synthase [Flavobacterium sp. CS20]|uniref:L-threonylcarbamoyladenylate synthase n=1 Tax=Flavobacterium sp. CS20 TaxID=2775246 RepID=UPI001B39EEB6|nr:L-threonylcarbamoyladenylate synthase [Flavobacterium sp. CS20]QTY27666.1 threonylcarbamoyl-AMP synthase [Flavobacterium sp. CS20]
MNTLDILTPLNYIKNHKTILYPTDTVWGIGCDLADENAVKKVYQLKQRDDSKALVCLVKDVDMLSKYVESIPDMALEYLKQTERPTTIIYPKAKHLARNLIAKDGSIAIRICQTEFCQNLLKEFGKPIVSTSANISGTPTPKGFKDIQQEILTGVDYVVNLQNQNSDTKPSRIIKFNEKGQVQIIRD